MATRDAIRLTNAMMPDSAAIDAPRSPGRASQNPRRALTHMTALTVLDRLPLPVIATDHDGSILFANQLFAAMVGRIPGTLHSMSLHDIVRGPLSDQLSMPTQLFASVSQGIELAHRDGSTVRAQMMSTAARTDDSLTLAMFKR